MFARKHSEDRMTRLVVNNWNIYASHRYVGSIRPAVEDGKFQGVVSAQFYNTEGKLYCTKIIWRDTYRSAGIARFYAKLNLSRTISRDEAGIWPAEVQVEMNRKINIVGR